MRSVMFRWKSREREQKKKRKRGAFPLIPAFSLVDVVQLLIVPKSFYTRVSCIESSFELCGSDTTGLRLNLARLSRLRQTHNNVQSLLLNRVWHRCETGKWEFVCKNFVCILLSWTNYFNLMVVCEWMYMLTYDTPPTRPLLITNFLNS